MVFFIEKMGLMIRWGIFGSFLLLLFSLFWKCFLHRMKRTGAMEFLYLLLVTVLGLSVCLFLIGIGSLFRGTELEKSAQSFSMWGHGIAGFRLFFFIKLLLICIWISGSIRQMIRKWNERKKMESLYIFNEVIADPVTIDCFTSSVQKSGLRWEPMLFQNQAVSVPFLKGVIHPAVILPEKDFTPDEKTLIFAHELSHFKSGDLLIRYLLELVFLIYWFIPFEEYWLEELIEIQESLCDISVCRIFGETFNAERYFSMILNISSGTQEIEKNSIKGHVDAQLLEDIGHLEKRVINMIGYQEYEQKPFFKAVSCTMIGVFLFLALSMNILDYSSLFHRIGETEEIIVRKTEEYYGKKISFLYSDTPQNLLRWNDTVEYWLEPGESVISAPFIGEAEQPLIVCAAGEHNHYSICVKCNNEILEIEAEKDVTSLNLEVDEQEYVLSLVNTGEEKLKILLYCSH